MSIDRPLPCCRRPRPAASCSASRTPRISDAPDLPTEPMPLNMGPSHPAMHGTVRMVLEVEGERIVQRRHPDRLPAPLLREGVGVRDLHAGLPVHRPPQLRLADAQQRRLRDGGREADGHRQADPRARAVHPRDRRRDVAHHRPPDLPGRQRDGAGRVHRRSCTCSRRASGCSSCSRRCRGARLTHSYVRIGGVAYDLPAGLRRQAARHPRRARRS